MNYRIKITSFGNGRKEFKPYVKKWGLVWFGLDYDGKEDLVFAAKKSDRDSCLALIDLHNKGNCRKTRIYFEYIEI